ncbi:transglycosylase family protein [Streptomyces xanthochromogenes]|uniref:transglycosylase family protein n=1 Tax=Streptomyces xanthochromogenes TaxID=67384 RepID=UPI0027E3E998|nr:transglycosylase family protein [Streptomyces xanthochromogenes]
MSRKLAAFALLPMLATTAVAVSASNAAADQHSTVAPRVQARSTIAQSAPATYTVQPGDTLSLIAQKQLGDVNAWQALYQSNRTVIGADPDLIMPGQKLRLDTAANTPQPPARPEQKPARPAPKAPSTTTTAWDRLADCESSGNWSINTGNGYYGGLQFTLQTWHEYGGTGMPNQASRSEQIRIAEKVLKGQGPGAWPVCSYEAGMR